MMKRCLLPISLCFILIGFSLLRKSDFSTLFPLQEQDELPIISQTGSEFPKIAETTGTSVSIAFSEPIIETKTLHKVSNFSLYDIFNEEVPESQYIRSIDGHNDLIKTAYEHTLGYPDLWLKITLPNIYTPTPHDERIKTIFIRTGNKLTTKLDESLTQYTKDKNAGLMSVLQRHLNAWCKVEKYTIDGRISGHYDNEVYSIRPQDGSFDSRNIECYPDKENHEDYMTPIMYFESQNRTKYYKLKMHDGCAPWPCTIFAKIEVL